MSEEHEKMSEEYTDKEYKEAIKNLKKEKWILENTIHTTINDVVKSFGERTGIFPDSINVFILDVPCFGQQDEKVITNVTVEISI